MLHDFVESKFFKGTLMLKSFLLEAERKKEKLLFSENLMLQF